MQNFISACWDGRFNRGNKLRPMSLCKPRGRLLTLVGSDHSTHFWMRSLSTARSVPEIIQCCFGVDDRGPREIKEWFTKLPADERVRRQEFKKHFKRHYEGFRALRLGTARHISEHRTGVAPVTVTISGWFGVTYIGNAVEHIPLSETRQIDDPDLAFLAHPIPVQPTWNDFTIEGNPFFPHVACRDYLDHARALIEEGRRIAPQVHGTKSLSFPPT